MAIYNNIKKLCKENGITVCALEIKLQFSSGSICKWDTNIPSVEKVKKVADCLGTTVDELINQKGLNNENNN